MVNRIRIEPGPDTFLAPAFSNYGHHLIKMGLMENIGNGILFHISVFT